MVETGNPPSGVILVPCPACKGESVYSASNPYRPFCCHRCRLADLGKWAAEDFRMECPPGEPDPNLE